MRKFLYYFFHFTWGILQNVGGFLWFLRYLCRPHSLYRGAILTRITRRRFSGGFTLGCFIFLTQPLSPQREHDLLIHEYGHTVQSLLLGPFWSLAVALPSMLWCHLPPLQRLRSRKNIPYSALYCEKWANRLGEKTLGDKLYRIF